MAYVVGSASVEILPDFRNAQLAITRFFAQQQNELKIQVKLDIKDADTKGAEQQAERAGSRITEAMNRGAAKNDAASIRAAERAAKQREQSITRAHAEALRINAALDRSAARVQQTVMRETQRIIEREANETSKRRIQSFKEEERAFQESMRAQIAALKELQREASRQEKIQLQVEIDERNAILAGRNTGGVITRAIQREMKENSGIIVAALAAGLIAGAPVAIGAATVLFAGIGAVAAFQNEQLRASWIGLWDEIKSGAVSDAAILVPTFDRMAGAIGAAFQRMRPLMRDAFEAVGPQVDSLTGSLIRMGDNALPGIVTAVERAMPVIRGFGDFFERTGTGVGAFFERLSIHAPAAGQAMSELGSTFEALLPALAEILGQGAELASLVLPVVTSGFRGLLLALDAVGGALPTVLAGFMAFRVLQGTGRFVTGFSKSLVTASQNGGAFAGVMGRAGSALSTVGRALPLVGVGVGLVTALMADSERRTLDWTAALNEGGDAARRAREEMAGASDVLSSSNESLEEATFGLSNFAIGATGAGAAVAIYGDDVSEAEQAHKDFLASLTPIESAQRQTDIATRELAKAMGDESTSAEELARLKDAVARAAANQAREEDALARATRGVTEAMAEQADAARARVDAAFAYEEAVADVAQAQSDLKDATAEFGAGSEEAAKATRELNEALFEQVTAAGEIAMSALPASMDDTQRAVLGAKRELDELNALVASGFVLPPAMEAYRQQLIGITNQADGATLAQAQLAAGLGEIGVRVEEIPDSKAVSITAPTDEVRARLEDLGFTVTNIPGTKDVRVEAETEEAKGNLGNLSTLLSGLGSQVARPTVDLDDGPFDFISAAVQNVINGIDRQRPTPVFDADPGPFTGITGAVQGVINRIHRENPRPTITAVDNATGIMGTILGGLGNVGRQNPRPTITAIDNATGPARAAAAAIAAVQSKTVTITVRSVADAGAALFRRDGGEIPLMPMQRFEGGGEPIRFTGATYGRGGPRDDLQPAWVSPGEHIFDARDVALMGGQAGVYAFREMLNAGQFRSPGKDTGVRQMVAAGAPRVPTPAPQGNREVTILTYDNPRAILRAVKADEQQTAALATPWP